MLRAKIKVCTADSILIEDLVLTEKISNQITQCNNLINENEVDSDN